MDDIVPYRCRLPLTAPLLLRVGQSQEVQSHREVVLLQNKVHPDRWAEASPLPGFSRESIDAVLAAVRGRQSEVSMLPSLQFALDCLALDEWPNGRIPINAMVTGCQEEIEKAGKMLANSECRTVKLKVGRAASVEEDVQRFNTLCSALKNSQTIRLDANRAWDLETATRFACKVDSERVEYIEEPVANLGDLETFLNATGCNYALDETVAELLEGKPSSRRFGFGDLRSMFPNVAALVVKPTLIGGVSKLDSLAQVGVPLVFSGSFESGIGTMHVARLAYKYSATVPAGLDTYSRLGQDVCQKLDMSNWSLDVGSPAVDVEQVRRLQS